MPTSLPEPRPRGGKRASSINFPEALIAKVDRFRAARGESRSAAVVALCEFALANLPGKSGRGTP